MPEGEEGKALTSADLGVSIEPGTWVEPKQTFPGIVVVSRYRLASDKYKEATQFRPAIADDLPQWEFNIERLDAKLLLPDGSQAPAIRYGGIDLRKWSNRESTLVPISSAYAKEWFVVSENKRVFGKLEPPEALVGKKAVFDFFPTKSFGGSIPSRNVLVPTELLSPDYEFTGDVQIIQVRAREGDEARSDDASSDAGTPTPAATPEPTDAEVLPHLAGKSTSDPAGIITALPAELRSAKVLNGIATGTLFEALKAAGKIAVADDGTISLV